MPRTGWNTKYKMTAKQYGEKLKNDWWKAVLLQRKKYKVKTTKKSIKKII